MCRLIIIGARALGREVCNYAREAGFGVFGFLDDKSEALQGFHDYPPVLSSVEAYQVAPEDRFICAIGDSKMRAKYAAIIEAKGGRFVNVIHPTAYIGPNVKMGEGCIVCPLAVLDCDLTIGRHVVVNVHALVSHDCVLEDYVTLSPNVHLGGRTMIRRETFLGIGASVIPDCEIGSETLVAAGAVITHSAGANLLLAGIPATPKRTRGGGNTAGMTLRMASFAA